MDRVDAGFLTLERGSGSVSPLRKEGQGAFGVVTAFRAGRFLYDRYIGHCFRASLISQDLCVAMELPVGRNRV